MKHPNRLLPAFAVGLLLVTSTPAIAIDFDGDGIEAEFGDCNDNNPSIYPGAFEIPGNEVDEDCDAHETCFEDFDNDIYRTSVTVLSTDVDCADNGEARAADPTGDCDDSDPDVNPGGFEVCDGGDVDEDCDGGADDNDAQGALGGTEWYFDQDGDAYGDPATDITACGAPMGMVADATDCDDADPAIHPGATEVCDIGDTDDDCDGEVDDNDTEATGKTSWYPDVDGDGYGELGGMPELRCDALAGYAGNDGDCDDSDSAISPGDPEICDANNVDEDCDSLSDCDDSSCSSAPSCGAVVFDHLECFKIKTTEKLKATLDLDPGVNPPFPVAPGCTIGKATKYCVPVMRPVATVDESSTLTGGSEIAGQDLVDDRICYKVKCPDTDTTSITITGVDRFGNREFTKIKYSEICTPAAQAP
jgi:hypothetical protein